MPIHEAKEFIRTRVHQPALNSDRLGTKAKNTVKNAILWLDKFERVGDLVDYVNRFDKQPNKGSVFQDLKSAGLETYEDIKEEFTLLFGRYSGDRTRLDDFVIGEHYTPFQLHIFAKTYDNRSGGILPIGNKGEPIAVFLKANLDGGKYPNTWLSEGTRFKYYLKSTKVRGVDNFNPNHLHNKAVTEFPDRPLFLFVRSKQGESFTFAGDFQNIAVHTEIDGSKWFELHRREFEEQSGIILAQTLSNDLQRAVQASKKSSKSAREQRLANAPKKPKKVSVLTITYSRNADVIAHVLERAAGFCEQCKSPAPFLRKTDNTPFLEVHHKIPLADGGDDTVENAEALCPNCHREVHFG